MSYIKLVVGSESHIPNEFLNNVDKAFDNLRPDDQAMFVLEQSIMLNFFEKLYMGKLPTLLENYAKNIRWMAETLIHANELSTDNTEIFKQCVGFIENIISGIIPENYSDILKILGFSIARESFPHALSGNPLSFYRPFLMYYGSPDRKANVSVVSLPTMSVRGRFIITACDSKFSEFKIDDTIKSKLDKCPYPINQDSIFAFLSGYNWKDYTFMGMLGILSSYCFDMDVTNAPVNSSEVIFKIVKTILTNYRSSVDPYIDELASKNNNCGIRRIFISFIIGLRQIYGLKIDSSSIISQIMGKDDKEDVDKLNSYLEAVSASEISVEMKQAFRNSIFAEFEELDISNRIQNTQTEVQQEHLSYTRNIRSLEESLNSLLLKDAKITGPAPLKNAKEKGDEAQSNPAKEEPSKPSDAGATEGDDTSGTGSGNDSDSSAEETAELTPPSSPTDGNSGSSDTSVPDIPDVSDKKGVKLELSSSETTDTVFYRMELKTYINEILANPPEDLSVEKLEILRKIKAFWINTLTPQCVHDIINTVIKLPKMFNIKSKKGK